MFSKATAELIARREAEAQRRQRVTGKHLTKQQKERRVMKIYGKSSADMAQCFHDRVEEWKEQLDDPDARIIGAIACEKKAVRHTFRSRSPQQELSYSFVSSMRSPSRRAFNGGGVLHRSRSAALKRLPRSEWHTTDDVPRVRQPPYEDPKYPWRTRAPAREMGPPMRYKAKTENERIQETIAKRVFNANDKYRPHTTMTGLRGVDKTKWKGDHFSLGRNVSRPLFSPISSSDGGFKPRIVCMTRDRKAEKEVGPTFSAVTPSGHVVQSPERYKLVGQGRRLPFQPPTSKQYSQTLRLTRAATADPDSIVR